MAKDDKKRKYEKDERVICYHGPLLYEAKILKYEDRDEEPPQYLVHYKGWKQTWDEWLPENHVLKYNDDNLQEQRKLIETHLKRKSSRATPSHEDTQPRSRKRHRDSSAEKSRIEDEATKQPALQLTMPDRLKDLLVDDWENVTKNKQVVRLPHTVSVSEILQQYSVAREDQPSDETLTQIMEGIKLYFNKNLDPWLLYQHEQTQYDQLRKAHPKTEFSDIYGGEHLLRLFVKMPRLITKANLDLDTLSELREAFTDILSFVQEHTNDYFPNEYEDNQHHQDR